MPKLEKNLSFIIYVDWKTMRACHKSPSARATLVAPAYKKPRLSGTDKGTTVATSKAGIKSAPSSHSCNLPSSTRTSYQKRLVDPTRGQCTLQRKRHTSEDGVYDELSDTSDQWSSDTDQEYQSDGHEDDPGDDDVVCEDCGEDCEEEPDCNYSDRDDGGLGGDSFGEVFEDDEEDLTQERRIIEAGTKTSGSQGAQPSRGLTGTFLIAFLTGYSKPDAIKYFDEKEQCTGASLRNICTQYQS